jgi:hypothetical protein
VSDTVDANERFGSDNQSNQGQGSATAWPDGTLITESERHAPTDARDLAHDLRRFRREERWAGRRRTFAQARRGLLSPRGMIALLLIAALAASAMVIALPLLR